VSEEGQPALSFFLQFSRREFSFAALSFIIYSMAVKKIIPWVLALSLLIFGDALNTSAGSFKHPDQQQKQEEIPRPSYEVKVIVTNIDVVVTDKAGKRVTGLRPEHFQIYEDGLLQKLTNFYEVKGTEIYVSQADKETGQPLPPPRPLLERTPRVANKIIFYFDNWHLHPMNRNWSIKKLEAFIRNNFGAGKNSLGMVVCLEQKLECLQDFTPESGLLLQAINDVKGRSGQALMRARTKEDLKKELNRIVSETSRERRFEDYEKAMGMARSYVEAEQGDLVYSLNSLSAFLDHLTGIEGRKILIYVSDGLPLNPSEEVFSFLDQAFPQGRAQAEAMNYDATHFFRNLTSQCNAHEVSLYPINSRGLETMTLSADQEAGWNVYSRGSGMIKPGSRVQDTALKIMAEETGGVAILNTNEIESGLKKIEDDFSYHYSLGYVSPSREDNKFHSIEVKLAGVKDGYTVRVRHGYLHYSPEETIKKSVFSRLYLERLYNPMNIKIQVLPEERIPGSDNLSLDIKLLIPIKDITLLENAEDYTGQIKVYVALKDAGGYISPCHELSQDIRIPKKDYGTAIKSYYPYVAEMFVKPGVYTISLAVRDVLGESTNYLQFERAVATK